MRGMPCGAETHDGCFKRFVRELSYAAGERLAVAGVHQSLDRDLSPDGTPRESSAAGRRAGPVAHGRTMLQPQTLSAVEQQVWDRELRYWDLRNSGKIDEYMDLWEDGFVGWPARIAQPGGKADIRKGIEADVGDGRPGSFTVKLEPLSIRIYGDVAVAFYRARYGRINNAGDRVEAYVRITHTWRRAAGVWRIMAGMSANEP